MPFDAGGNFTRVRNWKQDRDNGIRILADRHDEEDDNFAGGFNLAFLRTGTVPMTGNLTMGGNNIKNIKAGGAASPSITFELSNTTGFFQVNPNAIGVASGGVKVAEFNTAGLAVDGITPPVGGLTITGNAQVNGAIASTGTGDFQGGIYVGPPSAATDGNIVLRSGTSQSCVFYWQNGGITKATMAATNGIFYLSSDVTIFRDLPGNERMRIHTGGNVGIRVAVPASILHIAGELTVGYSGDPMTYNLAIAARVIGSGQVGHDFKTNDATFGAKTPMSFHPNGWVGVGQPLPGSPLHVKGGGDNFRIEGTVARGSGTNYMSFFDPTGRKGYIGYGSTDDGLYFRNEVPGNVIITGSSGYMSLGTANTERIFIGPTGDIGFNTTSPLGRYEFVGAVNIVADPKGTSSILQITAEAAPGGVSIASSYYAGGYGPLKIKTAGSERMSISASGLVGIGTVPTTAVAFLDVNSGGTVFGGAPSARFSINAAGGGVGAHAGVAIYYNRSSGQGETEFVAGNIATSYIAFGIHSGSGYAERVRIKNDGTMLNSTYGGNFLFDGGAYGSGKITQGTAAPSGGVDGDIYLLYT